MISVTHGKNVSAKLKPNQRREVHIAVIQFLQGKDGVFSGDMETFGTELMSQRANVFPFDRKSYITHALRALEGRGVLSLERGRVVDPKVKSWQGHIVTKISLNDFAVTYLETLRQELVGIVSGTPAPKRAKGKLNHARANYDERRPVLLKLLASAHAGKAFSLDLARVLIGEDGPYKRCSPSTVFRDLEALEQAGKVRIERKPRGSVVTLCSDDAPAVVETPAKVIPNPEVSLGFGTRQKRMDIILNLLYARQDWIPAVKVIETLRSVLQTNGVTVAKNTPYKDIEILEKSGLVERDSSKPFQIRITEKGIDQYMPEVSPSVLTHYRLRSKQEIAEEIAKIDVKSGDMHRELDRMADQRTQLVDLRDNYDLRVASIAGLIVSNSSS